MTKRSDSSARASVVGITKRSIMDEMGVQEPTAATYLAKLRNTGHVRHVGFNGGHSHVVWLPHDPEARDLSVPVAIQKRVPSIFHLGAML